MVCKEHFLQLQYRREQGKPRWPSNEYLSCFIYINDIHSLVSAFSGLRKISLQLLVFG